MCVVEVEFERKISCSRGKVVLQCFFEGGGGAGGQIGHR